MWRASGAVRTSETEDGARSEATDAMVPKVVLLAQVGRGSAGELESAADGTCESQSV